MVSKQVKIVDYWMTSQEEFRSMQLVNVQFNVVLFRTMHYKFWFFLLHIVLSYDILFYFRAVKWYKYIIFSLLLFLLIIEAVKKYSHSII